MLTYLGVPHVTTIHNRLDTPDLPPVVRRFPHAPLISISDHHRMPLPSANWLGTVYQAARRPLKPSYEPGTYLAFLGRGRKRPKSAIRIANAIGKELRMAAKIPRAETRYYKERLQPLIDGVNNIEFVGELNDSAKGALLGAPTRCSSRSTGPSRSGW